MNAATRNKLKALIEKAGLLPVAEEVARRLTPNEVKDLPTAARFYLYNSWITNFPSVNARLFYLRHVLGLKIGKGCFIHMGCFFEGEKISIGDHSVIGRHCFLGGNGGSLTIGDNVSITARVYIFCATHLVNSPIFEAVSRDVVIEDRAWIGAGATILPGVRIGRGAVLGAASTATKDVPDFAISVGVPAKEIGKRNQNLTYTLQYSPYFN